MKLKAPGVLPQSEIFIHNVSDFARENLFFLIDSGVFFCDNRYVMEQDDWQSYLFLLVRKGRLKFRYENREFIAGPNQCVFLNCHKPHMHRAEEDDTIFEWFRFDGNASASYFEMMYQKNGCVYTIGNNAKITENLDRIIQMSRRETINEHLASVIIHETLYELSELTNTAVNSIESIIKKATEYIENHFNQDISIEEVAQHVNLSPYHFSRSFKKYTSYSPYEYLLNYRLHHAKKLLAHTKLTVADIAEASGFNSAPHFVTTFKKRMNITPKQFREVHS